MTLAEWTCELGGGVCELPKQRNPAGRQAKRSRMCGRNAPLEREGPGAEGRGGATSHAPVVAILQ